LPRSDFAIYGESVATGVIHSFAWRNRTRLRSWADLALDVARVLASISSSTRPMPRIHLAGLFLLSCALTASASLPSEAWVPIRWTGGPLELAWRSHTKTLPADAATRGVLARWYDPATLNLLEDSPANCLLVTWSASIDAALETDQQQLVKAYAEAAHNRGLAVLGLIYAAGNASKIVAAATQASLDGLVLDGDFPREFPAALAKLAGSMKVIEIANDASSARWKSASIVAVTGVAPSAHNLSEVGIRGSPSSQPWIESNIWLVRSFAVSLPTRTVWISSRLENASAADYARAVADAAAAGGRWIISLDDTVRAKLLARDASALELWRHLSTYLIGESHAAWRALTSYGNVGIVLDPASTQPDLEDEYVKLATRRQVPYHLVSRSELSSSAIAKFRAIVATELNPPSAAERKLLQDFAENGGVVIAGPTWGNIPKAEPFAELRTGKGSVFVYKDPDPEAVAHDLKELLSDDDLGVVPFNVPSVITVATGVAPGHSLLIQLVNYFDHPVEAITFRIAGEFHSAHLETPDGAALDLPLRKGEGRTEVTIPKLSVWAAVSIE